MSDCGCVRERDCGDLRRDYAKLCEAAEKRRTQRDYLKDVVEELHRRIHDLECENRDLGKALAECRGRPARHQPRCHDRCRN